MSVTIREQSEQVKAASVEHLPAEVVEVFGRSVKQMRERGVPAGTVGVGDRLESFTLGDATEAPVMLEELVAAGPAVIVFYRGGWCPYCSLALRTYQQELLPQLGAFNARLVAISPPDPGSVPVHGGEGRSQVHGVVRPGQPAGPAYRHSLPASRRGPRRPAPARTRPGFGQRRGIHRAPNADRVDRRPGSHSAFRRCAARLHRSHRGR